MIPILFGSGATTFTSNGLGGLGEATSAHVTEERNGIYELEVVYPIDGVHFNDLAENKIILAKPAVGKDPQPFRIYKITKPINGLVEIYCEHISYQLCWIPVEPFTASSCADAIAKLGTYAYSTCPFTFWTDKDVTKNYTLKVPLSIRNVLGGVDGSIIDVYGAAELEWDFYSVKMWLHRGSNKGVTIRYGKNLTDLRQSIDTSNVITGVYPYWREPNGDTVVTLPEKVIENEYAETYLFKKTMSLDLSDKFSEQPTVEQLRTYANNYMYYHMEVNPTITAKISFVQLENTDEYKTIAPLETVNLCDTVTVVDERLNVSISAKVTKLVFDVLNEKYTECSLGNTSSSSLVKTIAETEERIDNVEQQTTTRIQDAVNKATSKITGIDGGFVVLNMDADGNPFELLIMNTNDVTTATNVWRFNKNGWGHSSTGYGGNYTMAATIDGGFVADFITTGTLDASLIKTGTITSLDGRSFVFDINNNSFSVGTYDEFMNLYNSHFSFSGGALTISNDNSNFSVSLSNAKLSFMQSGSEIAYITGYKLYIKDVRVMGGLEVESPDSNTFVRQYVDANGIYCCLIME